MKHLFADLADDALLLVTLAIMLAWLLKERASQPATQVVDDERG